MLNSQLFHGNVGNILGESVDQRKTIDCRYVKGCGVANCAFYHDPAVFPHSTDVRNYHIGQFIYRPANSERRSMRSFGSLDNATNDLAAETCGGVSAARDRAVHELLCALVLSKYFAVTH
jgi:hypothetical protein